MIIDEQVQHAYKMNMDLHHCTMQLEQVFQWKEQLLCQREQQIKELEEVPKIPVSPDEQLEKDHKMIMMASSNIVTLALEH